MFDNYSSDFNQKRLLSIFESQNLKETKVFPEKNFKKLLKLRKFLFDRNWSKILEYEVQIFEQFELFYILLT